MQIIKRNGQIVDFDQSKIVNAIQKANLEVPETARLSERWILAIADDVVEMCEERPDIVSVEEVQDMVQNSLIKHGAALVASKYITYRFTRALARKANTTDEEILSLIELANEEAKDENSNKNPTLAPTQRDYMAGAVSKDLTNRILLPKDVVDAHKAGILHFHDADYFSVHLLGKPLPHDRHTEYIGAKDFGHFHAHILHPFLSRNPGVPYTTKFSIPYTIQHSVKFCKRKFTRFYIPNLPEFQAKKTTQIYFSVV